MGGRWCSYSASRTARHEGGGTKRVYLVSKGTPKIVALESGAWGPATALITMYPAYQHSQQAPPARARRALPCIGLAAFPESTTSRIRYSMLMQQASTRFVSWPPLPTTNVLRTVADCLGTYGTESTSKCTASPVGTPCRCFSTY